MCITEGCGKRASFGVAGTKRPEYCTQNAPDGMVDVSSRMCSTEGYGKRVSFGVAGTKRPEYCTQHALDGMVHVREIKCITEGCGKEPSFGVVGRRGIGPYHSGKGTIDDASPSGSEHETVHSPPAQASPLSGGSCISCKQVQQPHNVPTTLKRAVILESAAGAVTMPEIEGQKSPVKRDPSVKTEVHVSL